MSDLLDLRGSAYERGRAQGAAAPAAEVRRATLARVEQARAEGVFDAAAQEYLAAQRGFMEAADPAGMAEVQGIADGFGFAEAEVFAHLHLGTLRDLKGGGRIIDGCSAWGVGAGPDGPLVAKNRDFSGLHLGIQRVARHAGPDVATGAMLCLGSLGSPGAYSSGINAAGLALADTQVPVATHRVGWLRYFLMTRLLADCATVAEALAMIRARPHAGGGTLILADAGGAVAAVELGAREVAIETGAVLWRTNHFVSDALAGDTRRPKEDAISDTSAARLDYLARTLPGREWTAAAAARLMGTHAADAPGAGPLCQHVDLGGTGTISSVVYSCKLRRMEVCEGSPCTASWAAHSLPG
jgi:hypothetical protein